MSVGHIFIGPKPPMSELADGMFVSELAARAFGTIQSIGNLLLRPVGGEAAAVSLSNGNTTLENYISPRTDTYTMHNNGGSNGGGSNGGNQGSGTTAKPGSTDEHVRKLGERHTQTWGK